MPSSMLQQRVSTNIPSSAELGAVKAPSVEPGRSTRSVTQNPSASHSRSQEVSELQLRVDELEAEKAYFISRIQALERRLHESEAHCRALEEAQQTTVTKTSSSADTDSPTEATSTTRRAHEGPRTDPARQVEAMNLQVQINELRHAVRELSQRNSLPRASSMEHSVRSELRSPPAVNPETQKLREVILHQQHIIKALQGELDWTISPSPTNAVAQASKSRTLPDGGADEHGPHAHSTARTVMATRSASDSKEPVVQTLPRPASRHLLSGSDSPTRPGAAEEPEPQPPQPLQPSTATTSATLQQEPDSSAITEEAEPFVMSYATLDPLAVLGNTSFDPFTGKVMSLDAHQRLQSDEGTISARSTALCGSRLSEAVQETATRLQLAFKDLDEEEAMTESAVTPPPRRAVLLPQLSAFDESFGDLEEPTSEYQSP